MVMIHRLAILVVLLSVALVGCQTATGRTAGTVVDDGSTTAAVKSKLVADRPANLTSVGVDTINGTVYLTGVVETPEQRMRAEQLAWETRGVRQIVNNIQVQRPSATPSASAATGVPRRTVVGTVDSVDSARNQVTVSAGGEQLLLQLPATVVRDLRRGDQVTLDVSVQPRR
jgi:hypothetical protein